MAKLSRVKISFLTLAALSAALYGYLAYGMLSYTPVCSRTDQVCLSAQTVSGDLSFALAVSLYALVPVWLAAISIYLLLRWKNSGKRTATGSDPGSR